MARVLNTPISLEELLLNSGLNEDCLVEILSYLNISDLLIVCTFDSEGDKTFTELIREKVASKILFDLDAISIQRTWSITKIFEIVGSKMTKIKVTVSLATFNYYMEKIIRFCDPNRLKELHIKTQFGFQLNYDFPIMERMRPFFANLKKLKTESENIYQRNELRSVINF